MIKSSHQPLEEAGNILTTLQQNKIKSSKAKSLRVPSHSLVLQKIIVEKYHVFFPDLRLSHGHFNFCHWKPRVIALLTHCFPFLFSNWWFFFDLCLAPVSLHHPSCPILSWQHNPPPHGQLGVAKRFEAVFGNSSMRLEAWNIVHLFEWSQSLRNKPPGLSRQERLSQSFTRVDFQKHIYPFLCIYFQERFRFGIP